MSVVNIMGKLLNPKCFLSLSFFLLTILSIYGIVGLVLNYFESTKIHNFGEWPFNLHPLFYAFIGIQGLLPVAGLFAIISTCKRQPLFMYGSGSVLLGIFTCASVFGIVSYRPTEADILGAFYTALTENFNNSEMLTWMNSIQWKHKCCGVYSYVDWSEAVGNTQEKSKNVPSSCCRREEVVPNESCGVGIMSHGNQIANKLIYTSGCGSQVSQTLKETLHRVGIEIYILAGVSLLVAIFLYVGISKIYLEAGDTLLTGDTSGNDADSSFSNGTSGSRTQSIGKVSMKNKKAWSGSKIDAANNNTSVSATRKDFGKRKRRQKGKSSNSQYRKNTFGMSQPQTSVSRFSNNHLRRDINASKSFILGEARSHLLSAIAAEGTNDPDILRKNVDMLWYQSLEKNMSTLSTTPHDINSINFPFNMQQSKKPIFSPELMNAINEERNTIYTLVSERPFTPSLSQNCSISFFNNYPIKLANGNGNGMEAAAATTGQSSPHFSSSKQQRVTHSSAAAPAPSEDEPSSAIITMTEEFNKESDPTILPNVQSHITPSVLVPTKTPDESNEIKQDNPPVEVKADEGDNDSSNESLISQITAASAQVTGSVPPPAPSPASSVKHPMSTVRSSTLATIHEESESAKGTPANAKGASPASGYMSPENMSPHPSQTKLDHQQLSENVTKISDTENNQVGVSSNDEDKPDVLHIRAIRVGQQEYTEENTSQHQFETTAPPILSRSSYETVPVPDNSYLPTVM